MSHCYQILQTQHDAHLALELHSSFSNHSQDYHHRLVTPETAKTTKKHFLFLSNFYISVTFVTFLISMVNAVQVAGINQNLIAQKTKEMDQKKKQVVFVYKTTSLDFADIEK